MAVDWSGTAPGVASSVASITQAIAAIQNMKFQRLLQLAAEQREDRLRQEKQAFEIGMSQKEHEDNLEEIDQTGKWRLMAEEQPTIGEQLTKDQMGLSLTRLAPDDPDAARLNSWLSEKPDDFTYPKTTWENDMRLMAGIDKIETMGENNRELADVKSEAALAAIRARTGGDIAKIKERGNVAAGLEELKQDNRLKLQDKRQTGMETLTTLKAQLYKENYDAGNALKNAEKLKEMLVANKDEYSRFFTNPKEEVDAKAALDSLNSAINSRDMQKLLRAIDQSRAAIAPAVDKGIRESNAGRPMLGNTTSDTTSYGPVAPKAVPLPDDLDIGWGNEEL